MEVFQTIPIVIGERHQPLLLQREIGGDAVAAILHLVAHVSVSGDCQIEIAPVDAQIVAAAVEGLLNAVAHPPHRAAGDRNGSGKRPALSGFVQHQLLADRQMHPHVMGLPIQRLGGQVQIADRTGGVVEILRQNGGGKHGGQPDPLVSEHIGGAAGVQLHGDLGQLRDGRRGRIRAPAHEAPGVSVDGDETQQRIGAAGPVEGLAGIQLVLAPDGEIGIHRDQRDRRGTQFHGTHSYCKFVTCMIQ